MAVTHTWLRLDQIDTERPIEMPAAVLVETVRKYGQLFPIRVRPIGEARYKLIGCADLFAAAVALGLESIEVIVATGGDAADPTDLEAMILHVQQKGLRTLYLARHVQGLIQCGHLTQAQLSREFGIHRSTLCHMLRVLECPDLVTAVQNHGLEWGAAKELAGLPTADRAALLEELKREKRHRGKFPTIAEVVRRVHARSGKGRPEIPRYAFAALVQVLEARGVPYEIVSARRSQMRIALTESDEDCLRSLFADHLSTSRSSRAAAREPNETADARR